MSISDGSQEEEMRSAIHKLDDLTISRIAAGEVVERPSSVVKELLENSIDAGALRIDIAIRNGGRTYVSVSDDGSGIPAEQLELAVERHATSKLVDDRSLMSIRSLGFRGEALAAISSVSRMMILSKHRDSEMGQTLVVDSGRVVDCAPAGAPVGTRVVVEDLFRDVPARRKFLRSDSAEAGRVTEVVTRYALAYPDRRFTLERNGRRVIDTPGRGDLKATLGSVLGPEIARDLLEVAFSEVAGGSPSERELIRVRGAVGSAHVHRANRRGITLFVNGRWITDPRLSAAVVQAYRTLIPERRFPIAVLSIEMPPELVDVNVHPAKSEVRFREPDRMFRVVRDAVFGALGSSRIGARIEGPAPRSGTLWRPPDRDSAVGIAEGAPSYPSREPGPQMNADGSQASHSLPERLPPLRVLGQIARCYIVAEGPDSMYLIDQHAAHERIVFESLLSRVGPPASQSLLEPIVVELDPDEAEAFEGLGEGLASIGFLVEPFGDAALMVRSIPEVLAGAEPSSLLRGVLQSQEEGERPVQRAIEERLARAACKRGSVKAGQTLSEVEIRELVTALERCDSPHTCPHGRPTVIVLGLNFFERSFGRL